MNMHFIKRFTPFLLLPFILIGCKDSGTGSGVDLPAGTVQATINGTVWTGTGAMAITQTVSVTGGKVPVLSVVGTKLVDQATGKVETLTLTIYGELGSETIEKRTYDALEDEIPGAYFLFVDTDFNYFYVESGKLTVSSLSDKNVKGTFEGTLVRTNNSDEKIEVTKGEFNADIGFSFSF